jgi:hypothetical protein
MVPDRLHQGMLNALLLNRLVTSSAFIEHPTIAMNGQALIDPARRFYYGWDLLC